MTRRREVRLMRMDLPTDYDPDNDARGSFSSPFMVAEHSDIVAVDWSTPGTVTVTVAVPNTI